MIKIYFENLNIALGIRAIHIHFPPLGFNSKGRHPALVRYAQC